MFRERLMRAEALLVLVRGRPTKRHGVDRDEEKSQARGLVDARPGEGRVVGVERQAAHVPERRRRDGQAEGDHEPHVDDADQPPDDRHQRHHGEPAGRDDEAGVGRGVAEELLDQLGDQDRAAEQDEAQHHHQDVGEREVAALEQMEVDDRVVVAPFPDHEGHERQQRQRRQRENEARGEPVRPAGRGRGRPEGRPAPAPEGRSRYSRSGRPPRAGACAPR